MNIPRKTIVSCAVILFLVTAAAVLYVGYRGFDNYIHMAQKAKRSEAPSNLDVIRNAELDFFKTEGHYLPLDIPADDPNMSKKQPTAHSDRGRDMIDLGVRGELLFLAYSNGPVGSTNGIGVWISGQAV